MNTHTVLALLTVALVVASPAQTPLEPTELTTLRESWERATRQATAPLDRKYLEALGTMKLRFTKEGKLNEALAVDREIQKLGRVPDAPPALGSSKLAIISATYGEKGTDKVIDTTDILRRALEKREDGVRLNTKFGADGKDPAPAAPKETTITYSIRGETKRKTFPENYDLKFKVDLK